MGIDLNIVNRYWGKADPNYLGEPKWHPLVYHSFDVAAVGKILLLRQPGLLRSASALTGIDEEALLEWVVFLLSLHDIGKFADGFQAQVPALFEYLQQRKANAAYTERHDALGYRFCRESIGRMFRATDDRWSNVREADLWDLLDTWVGAVTGHHGRPPLNPMQPMPINTQFPGPVTADADSFMSGMRELLHPAMLPFAPNDYEDCFKAFRRGSWLVAGIAVAADWIGSSQNWFPYVDASARSLSLHDYWHEIALPQAEVAVRESGMTSIAVCQSQGIRHLFPAITEPTPLQKLVEEIELSNEPQLLIIEEVTGGGKTEAALTLAHRLMAAGSADGIYMALPTMATANAMYKRVSVVYRRFYTGGADPSLVLAHSSSRMVLDLDKMSRADRGYGRERSVLQDCTPWLTDSRKKALLAHVGVGTIDQALLAVLAARHQSLRLLGLARKILIVDEVHACDVYVHRILCTLLRFHAAQGGSAILLSATLPRSMRRELLDAYAEGAGPANEHYPLFTQVAHSGVVKEFPVKARESASRSIEVRPLYAIEGVRATIRDVLDAGGCACWVRNTVYDASIAYGEWVEQFGERDVMLFHARFALGDRLRIEQEVLRCFGPDSADADRKGKLLIATQVVEQSLDLDFDTMVSDLAPIDLLIQRAGRMQRHARDRRVPPVLDVFMPRPSADVEKDWFKSFLPKAAGVYPHHGQLWLTARWLTQRGAFAVPQDARAMIESVYGDTAQEEVPFSLQRLEDRAHGEDNAEESLGRLNSLKLDEGYRATMTQWQDDVYAPTRLGEPMVMVRLARWDGVTLAPWCNENSGHDWELSQVSVRQFVIAAEEQGVRGDLIAKAKANMPDEGRYCVVVPMEEMEGKWVGHACDKSGAEVRVLYDPRIGLQTIKGENE